MAKKSKQPSPTKAKEMLHNPPHGKALTDKQRKYFGYLSTLNLGGKMENQNNNSTHFPQGFVGAGYNNIGRNYSPAWGGQFQMGGSIPGAVGFTYARTGSTPSNGNYAKKTKPSAKDGTYFQNGLDFKTKGMQKGGKVIKDNKGQWNHPGKVTQIDSPNITMKGVPYPVLGVSNTGHTQMMHPEGQYTFHGSNVTEYPMLQTGGGIPFNPSNYGKNPLTYRDSVNYADQFAKQKYGTTTKEYIRKMWENPPETNIIEDKRVKQMGDTLTMLHPTTILKSKGFEEYLDNQVRYEDGGSIQDKGQLKKLRQLTDFSNNNNMEQAKDGKWIQGAINPKHKGFCTPMTKSTCTPKRKALAKTFKKHHGFHENGGLVPYAQNGTYQPLNFNQTQQVGGYGNYAPQQLSVPNQQPQQISQYGNYQSPSPNLSGQGESTMGDSGGGGGNMLGNIGQGMDLVGGVVKGIKMLKQEKIQMKQAEQNAHVTDVVARAADTRPEKVKRKYVRPEDVAIQPNQMFPTYGAGTNYLSGKNGVSVMGEIQNTYAPNTLYTDLGYEPLNDSGKVKQFKNGGKKAQWGAVAAQVGGGQTNQWGQTIGSSIGNGNFTTTPNGGSQIGSSVGGAIGSIFGPIGSMVGGFAGGVIGGAIDRKGRKITEFQGNANRNLDRIATQQSFSNLQAQNSAFVKNGGEISNWNPQVITKFGDYTAKEVYDIAHEGMHSLRTGGNIRQNTMALGGELKVHGGGHAESISANPYLPDGGQTVMFRGKSHAEGGMPISFGNSPVEVEGGEPAVKLQDGGSGQDNLVVFGNMKIPSYGVSEIGDKDAKGMKFKNYIAKLSEKEAKQNKTVDKGLKLINDTDDNNAFDQLKIASGKALLTGGNMKLKLLAEQKQAAANVQNAILETAHEHGLESDALAQGKIKKAKNGAKMTYAQNGSKSAAANIFDNVTNWFSPDQVDSLTTKGYKPLPNTKNILFKDTKGSTAPKGSEDFNKAFGTARKQGVKEFTWKGKKYGTELASPSDKREYVGIRDNEVNMDIPSVKGLPPLSTPGVKGGPNMSSITPIKGGYDGIEPRDKGNYNYLNTIGSLWPYFRPTNQIGLDPNQLSGEYYALSNNQLDPVNAQRYTPILDQPYDISLQDQLNANQSDFNAIQRQTNYNPAAQSVLAGQKYAANSHVLGEQMRINQANKAGIYSKNRDTLNDAQLKNLALLDQQYVRQSQAKSNTKATAQQALSSIASKIQQNKLENRTLGVYENLYNYRYDTKVGLITLILLLNLTFLM